MYCITVKFFLGGNTNMAREEIVGHFYLDTDRSTRTFCSV